MPTLTSSFDAAMPGPSTVDTRHVYSPVTSASYTHPQQAQVKGTRERPYYPQRTDSQYTDYSATSDTVIKHEQQDPVVKHEQDEANLTMQAPYSSHTQPQVQPQPQVQVRSQQPQLQVQIQPLVRNPYAAAQQQSATYSNAPQSAMVISPVQQEPVPDQGGTFLPSTGTKYIVQHAPNQDQIAHREQFGYYPPLPVSPAQANRDARTPMRSRFSDLYRANILAQGETEAENERERLSLYDDAAQLATGGRVIGQQTQIEEQYV